METIFEILKPYMIWTAIVVGSFLGIVLFITDVSRKILHYKITKVFPVYNGPLNENQMKLFMKKAEYDLRVLRKDLEEWRKLKDERKITQCKFLINDIGDMRYLTGLKLLTPEQIEKINNYMLNYKPIYDKTQLPWHKNAA